MKRVLAIVLFLIVLVSATAAPAEDWFPDWSEFGGYSTVDNDQEYIEIVIDGGSIPLAFDGSTEYSSVVDGIVQASFFAYTDNSDFLYELYMIFPDTVQSGSTITSETAPQNDPNSSVVMIISTKDEEKYYFAGQMNGKVYPVESSYTMSFDTVSGSDTACTYAGKLTASLVEMEKDSGSLPVSIRIDEAPFSFTIQLQTPDPSEGNPFDPSPDDQPDSFDPSIFDVPSPTPKAWRV